MPYPKQLSIKKTYISIYIYEHIFNIILRDVRLQKSTSIFYISISMTVLPFYPYFNPMDYILYKNLKPY